MGVAHSLDEGAESGHAVEYVAMEDLPFSGLLEAGLSDTRLSRLEIQQAVQSAAQLEADWRTT